MEDQKPWQKRGTYRKPHEAIQQNSENDDTNTQENTECLPKKTTQFMEYANTNWRFLHKSS